jgi:hypothetical protein
MRDYNNWQLPPFEPDWKKITVVILALAFATFYLYLEFGR